jgi:hypothetical protein
MPPSKAPFSAVAELAWIDAKIVESLRSEIDSGALPLPRRVNGPVGLFRFLPGDSVYPYDVAAQRAVYEARLENRRTLDMLRDGVNRLRTLGLDEYVTKLEAHVAKHWRAPSTQDVAGQRSPRGDAMAMGRGGNAEIRTQGEHSRSSNSNRAPLEKARQGGPSR